VLAAALPATAAPLAGLHYLDRISAREYTLHATARRIRFQWGKKE
jgi:hypothetical protein